MTKVMQDAFMRDNIMIIPATVLSSLCLVHLHYVISYNV